jgi:hypothetical protein
MRRAHAAAFVLALLAAAPARAGVEITTAGDRLSVTAVRAPLADVLAGLARETRMKVVYEGATPRTLVSVELRAQTPAQAVLGVLEGLGLNFALILDPSGTHVETLMIVGAAGGSAATGATPGPGRPRTEPARANLENAEIPDDDDEPAAMEVPAPADPHEVPKEPPRPSPLPTGPINPTSAYPNSPFAPVAKPPAPAASPAASPPPP